eukprot:TRINITY_DN24411_c0_g1_i1.p1 TRINITY_DN24411_c0_g1~~TRINITY_DN24411_c0_g1_i1.p1  ORF type:complete len:558 (+),score=124.10 TRINITY_DN24411_c0_g1_i1:58-1731(+)
MGAKQTNHCLPADAELVPDVSVVLLELDKKDEAANLTLSPQSSLTLFDWRPISCLQQNGHQMPDTFLMLDEIETEADRLKRQAREEEEEEEKRKVEAAAAAKRKAEAAEEEKRRKAEEAAEAERAAQEVAAAGSPIDLSTEETPLEGRESPNGEENEDARSVTKLYLVFEVQSGDGQQIEQQQKQVCITRMPMGFIFGFPWLDVRRMRAGCEAQEQGIKNGSLLRAWGTEVNELHVVSEENRDEFREALSAIAKQLPRVALEEEANAPESAVEESPEIAARANTVTLFDLKVTIVGAKGLRDADWAPGGGGSDPYCHVSIQGQGSGSFKTATISDTQHPQWNETHLLNDFHEGDTLLVTVMDSDYGKSDDLLGQVRIPSRRVVNSFEADLVLRSLKKDRAGVIRMKLEASPREEQEQVNVGRDFSAVELEVHIIGAKNLRDADWGPTGGRSDPYCICEVHGAGKSTFRTKTINDTSNPTWGETGKIPDFTVGDELWFKVLDKDYGKQDDFLGKAVLKTDKILPFGFKGQLPLIEEEGGADPNTGSTLSVQVKVLRRY